MKKYCLNDFLNGKIVGNFNPSIYKTVFFEIAIQNLESNDFDDNHYHVFCEEIIIVIDGKIKINEEIFNKNEISVIEPREVAHFLALEKSTICVIKIPSILNDKHLIF